MGKKYTQLIQKHNQLQDEHIQLLENIQLQNKLQNKLLDELVDELIQKQNN